VSILPLPVHLLKPHEQYIEHHARELTQALLKDKVQKDPIVVDANTFVILDGHHRYEAAKRIGLRKIIALLVDYTSPEIKVDSWRNGTKVTKQDVIRAGLTGNLLPPKTSKHIIPYRPANINIPLELLK